MTIDDIKHPHLKSWFKAFKEYPTESNGNFLVGYITALREIGYIHTAEAAELGDLARRLEALKNGNDERHTSVGATTES